MLQMCKSVTESRTKYFEYMNPIRLLEEENHQLIFKEEKFTIVKHSQQTLLVNSPKIFVAVFLYFVLLLLDYPTQLLQ